jgi:hypothetical protein
MSDDQGAAAIATQGRRTRRRKLALAVAAAIILGGVIGYGAMKYFWRCGDCGGTIICPEPCRLPHFS